MTDKPTIREVRDWAMCQPGGHLVGPTGLLPKFVVIAWNKAHPDRQLPMTNYRKHSGGQQ